MNKKEMKKLDLDKLFGDSEDNKIEEAKTNIEVNSILLSIEWMDYIDQVKLLEDNEFLTSFVNGYKWDINIIIKKDD